MAGPCKLKWGTGKKAGPFSVIESDLCSRAMVSVVSEGRLWVDFGSFREGPRQERFRAVLASELRSHADLKIPDDQATKYPCYSERFWAS